ncbi:hypothetical protein E4U30_007225 [Claviceps sp. LM220 group G6]|nr:hypothetical protein E4U30_007225 [Claviceps sp. LM220 group G6]
MAAQVSHVEEFGPNEGLGAVLAYIRSFVQPRGIPDRTLVKARDWLLPSIDDGRSQLMYVCVSGNYFSPLHREIRVVGSKHHRDGAIHSRHVTLQKNVLIPDDYFRFVLSALSQHGNRDEARRYIFLNIDYEERITFVNEMANLRNTGPGQQMILGALPEEFVELFSTIVSGMRISLRAIDQGNGRKEFGGLSW